MKKESSDYQNQSLVRETGLFLAASTAASVTAALTCHWHVIHPRFIQVQFPVYWIEKDPILKDQVYFNGTNGDTELFEKPSNINGFGLSDNFFSCIAS